MNARAITANSLASLGAFALLLVVSLPVWAAPPTLETIVTNDDSNPVPVTGSVDVNVVGTPETEVVNAGLFVIIPGGSPSSPDELLYQVPEDKRLVIEQVSITVATAGTQDKRVTVDLELGSIFNDVRFALPVPELLTQLGSRAHVLTQSVTLYSEVGADIEVRASRSPDLVGSDTVKVRIWGRLIDGQQ